LRLSLETDDAKRPSPTAGDLTAAPPSAAPAVDVGFLCVTPRRAALEPIASAAAVETTESSLLVLDDAFDLRLIRYCGLSLATTTFAADLPRPRSAAELPDCFELLVSVVADFPASHLALCRLMLSLVSYIAD